MENHPKIKIGVKTVGDFVYTEKRSEKPATHNDFDGT